MEEVLELLIGLVVFHELRGVELAGLLQGRELDILGRVRFVREGSLYRAEVVRADGDERAPAADVLVQLILEIDERVVASLVELDAAEHGAHDEGPDEQGLRLLDHLLPRRAVRWLQHPEHGRRFHPAEHVQGAGDALHAEKIVAVGGDVDLVDLLVLRVVAIRAGRAALAQELVLDLLLGGDLVELDAELEAQLVELLLGVLLAEATHELIAVEIDGRL